MDHWKKMQLNTYFWWVKRILIVLTMILAIILFVVVIIPIKDGYGAKPIRDINSDQVEYRIPVQWESVNSFKGCKLLGTISIGPSCQGKRFVRFDGSFLNGNTKESSDKESDFSVELGLWDARGGQDGFSTGVKESQRILRSVPKPWSWLSLTVKILPLSFRFI